MRRFALAIAAVLVILAASAIGATRAVAMSMTAPAGLAPAINETSATAQVYWRRHWRRHYWRGWGRHFWGGWHRFWWGFPFFGPGWHWHPHHIHHHRPHKASQQKQDGEQKQEEQPQK